MQTSAMDSVKFVKTRVMDSGFIRGQGRAKVRRRRTRQRMQVETTGSLHWRRSKLTMTKK